MSTKKQISQQKEDGKPKWLPRDGALIFMFQSGPHCTYIPYSGKNRDCVCCSPIRIDGKGMWTCILHTDKSGRLKKSSELREEYEKRLKYQRDSQKLIVETFTEFTHTPNTLVDIITSYISP
jgi:hypothetical protein